MKRYNHNIVKAGALPIAYVKINIGQQDIIYNSEVYGEGWNYQNGLYNYERYIGIQPILVDFFTLHASTPNAMGTLQRFTSVDGNYYDYADGLYKDIDGNALGTQTVGACFNQYFIDHYTGAGLQVSFGGSMSYDAFIGVGGWLETTNTTGFLGYNDWRGMTVAEDNFYSRFNTNNITGSDHVQDWIPMNDTRTTAPTITTYLPTTSQIVTRSRITGGNSNSAKTTSFKWKLIRDHYKPAP